MWADCWTVSSFLLSLRFSCLFNTYLRADIGIVFNSEVVCPKMKVQVHIDKLWGLVDISLRYHIALWGVWELCLGLIKDFMNLQKSLFIICLLFPTENFIVNDLFSTTSDIFAILKTGKTLAPVINEKLKRCRDFKEGIYETVPLCYKGNCINNILICINFMVII